MSACPSGSTTSTQFYARLRDSSDLPSTSQPSVGDFLACFEPLASAGRDIVSIHIASGLSGTCESAGEAARVIADKGLPGRVEVVDGQTGAGGLGCLVLAAAGAAEQGLALGAVVDAVHRTREGLEMWFCLDTLEYLRQGGSHRRRAGPGRLGLEDQADPHLRHRDHSGRPRPHPQAGDAADGRLPARAPRPGRERLVRPARPVVRRRRGPGRAGEPRSSAKRRSSAPRSARCSAPTSAPECWSAASAASRGADKGWMPLGLLHGRLGRVPTAGGIGGIAGVKAQPLIVKSLTGHLGTAAVSGAPAR